MKSKCIILLAILLSVGQLFGQQKTVEEEYTEYFTLPREALHIHLNKTTFFKGEEIWFKGYAYDQKNQLSSKATTNINIGIYDAQGNQLKKALFAAENGVTNGNFAVDSTFTAGTYYLKAETNWMKNFKENNAFIQKIEIITDQSIYEEKATEKASFDFQFLPEGGHIVANTTNNIGFKVIDNNGKGVTASGIVYDQDKKQVASFESNTLGMGKFLFQPKKDIQYTAEITLENGATITKEFPNANAQGISLMLQSLSKNDIILDFNTNTITLKNNPSKTYKILIHQNGKLKTIPLQFDGIKKAIRIPKKELFKGINTITVFDDNKNPILERLFFNDYDIKYTDVNITKLNTIQDSILLSVKALNLDKNANLSISVLPETTESYQPQHNILSNFYLKPHVRGFVENPHYYFEKMNRKKKYELDILLLTQGWSRYEWKNIFETKPTRQHRFENGITVAGRVNVPNTGVERIFLYATKNHNARFIDLDADQKFELTNLFVDKDEEIRFSYVTEKGALEKPNMYLRFKTTNDKDKIAEVFLKETKNITTTADFTVPKNFFHKKVEKLETVVLNAEKRKKDRSRTDFLIAPRILDITPEINKRHTSFVDFIQNYGFNAQENAGKVSISSSLAMGGTPAVYLNDIRLYSLDPLFRLSLISIETVITDKFTMMQGIDGTSMGVIKIYTRKTGSPSLFKKPKKKPAYLSAVASTAFTTGKKYYSPNYTSYLNPVFQKYGAISWLPTVQLNTETATTFKIYDTYTEHVTLFIEGISENGDLISKQKTIKVR